MSTTEKITANVADAQGRIVGRLIVELPGLMGSSKGPPPLLDLSREPADDSELEPLQLLEGTEYRYSFARESFGEGQVTLEPKEVFSPDTSNWCSGRLRPGLYTGTMQVVVLLDGRESGTTLLEVRSRKLEYLSQYRWMLEEIADNLSELLMERFAPTEQSFAAADHSTSVSLYQQFAFLKSLFTGRSFEAAVQHVISRPHRQWVEETETRRPGQPLPMNSRIARQFGRPGPRIPWESGVALPVSTLPASLRVVRTEETQDTPENRFVKHALLRWCNFAAEVERVLLLEPPNAPVQRGLREVQAVVEKLNALLATDLFSEIGQLNRLPAGSQVLQKRAGYREIYRAYLQFEAAAKLTWDGGDDVYGAGQRNVAALYEYWSYLQLVRIMEQLCQRQFDRSGLFAYRPGGMSIALRRGRARGVKGNVTRLGRKISIELWYNRTFSHRLDDRDSWSRPMQPDFSLLLKADEVYGESDEVWLHFDAKYRVDTVEDLFGPDSESTGDDGDRTDGERAAPVKQKPKREDLLKMHAYRDAIRRSAGAYVLYPGTEPEPLQVSQELLPGLGAFPLRPTQDGTDTGSDLLYRFIDDVITHIATQTTQYERTRFWTRRVADQPYTGPTHPVAPFLSKPPADTLVLLGYVRKAGQLQWIHEQQRYNLRADPGRNGSVRVNSQELAAEYVLLYGSSVGELELWKVQGAPELHTAERMERSGYRDPNGNYFCLPLVRVQAERWLEHLTSDRVNQLRAAAKEDSRYGEPVAVAWSVLLQCPGK